MHLLLAQRGSLSESHEAIDLNQSPGDVLFLSFADTELAMLAHARKSVKNFPYTLRLANLATLIHPMSIDMYAEKTASYAKLIVIRLLGGRSYWQYGTDVFYAMAVRYRIKLAFLSGEDTYDESLEEYSTVPAEDCRKLWSYLVGGGIENGKKFLHYTAFLLQNGKEPEAARPLLKAAIWRPDQGEEEFLKKLLKNNDKKIIAICFYRALVESGQTQPVESLVREIEKRGIIALPFYITSLKNQTNIAILDTIFSRIRPDIILNATGFSASTAFGSYQPTLLEKYGNMVLQVIFSSLSLKNWNKSLKGLDSRDLAMNVALPEMDGRVLSRAVSFKDVAFFDEDTECNIITHRPVKDRIRFVIDLAENWLALRSKTNSEKKIALILANYPGGDGRLGHGVGLDTVASLFLILRRLEKENYAVSNLPYSEEELMKRFQEGPTNQHCKDYKIYVSLSLESYQNFFHKLPLKVQKEITAYWGAPEEDPFVYEGAFALPVLFFGNIIAALQVDRVHFMDKKQTYHANDIPPCHRYLAFYFWLRFIYKMDACVHLGKHGNLEWLPGKALALGKNCYPEIALGATPHIYPFIVNDPGEGTQAKRRSSAVIIDHLIPPLTRAESYGALKDLESLIDEYYHAAAMDERRLEKLQKEIFSLVEHLGLKNAMGIEDKSCQEEVLVKIDAFLCDLKELQIRNGLHVFGKMPLSEVYSDFLLSLTRLGDENFGVFSLQQAIAKDLELDFDPLTCNLSEIWEKDIPDFFQAQIKNFNQRQKDKQKEKKAYWRNYADAVAAVEDFAKYLLENDQNCPFFMQETQKALSGIKKNLIPLIEDSIKSEMENLLKALKGEFVSPGPSGAPTRGRLDVLPTGRNFYALDNRNMPTRCAWEMGRVSAELLIRRYVQDQGDWPRAFALNVWGTANMRSGGDDIAQAFALIGAKLLWNTGSSRVKGYEIIPLACLQRPRIDVVLRVSGFFRDAFPEQIRLFQQAIQEISRLEEDDEDNYIAYHVRIDKTLLQNQGLTKPKAEQKAKFRVFSSNFGYYGTGIGNAIKSGNWTSQEDFADIWTEHSAFAYEKGEMLYEKDMLQKRLRTLDGIVQNQDNREHDLLDSSEYYAFEGGLFAAIKKARGCSPIIYHNDHSKDARPIIKTLEEEFVTILHGRAINPKWLKAIMRHGYKGGSEICSVVEYVFAFAATTDIVKNEHFALLYQAYLQNDEVYNFLKRYNKFALKEIAHWFEEAIRRNLWQPQVNSIEYVLKKIMEE